MEQDNLKKTRKQILDNLEIFKDILNDEDHPTMETEEENTIYNEICDLIGETKATQTASELEEVVTRAKTIEKKIDLLFSKEGKDTLDVSWEG
jgi:hypothetical protein